jgi:acyl-CoA synthetase (AMP-forming)/AMP-acid ligase II
MISQLRAMLLHGDEFGRTQTGNNNPYCQDNEDLGYVNLVDRTSDVIMTGGYNVHPREVEDALMTHPAVAEAAVVGAPDATWVEAVTAFVALRPGAAISEDELRNTVLGRIAGHKVPKTVTVVDAIPKSPVGKILRRALRDPLWTNQRETVLAR